MKRLSKKSLLPMCAILFLLTGCRGFYGSRMQANLPSDAIVPAHPWAARGLPMFEGETGRIATWSDLMEGVAWADVVVLGEEHDDEVAHRFQLAIVEEMLATWPKTAVALEMIERDEQDALDAYLAGEQDRETFLAAITSSEKGQETFAAFYLPIIDSAGETSTPVVGANAPRRHARMARLEGYKSLRTLEPEERKLFDIPPHLDDGAYRDEIEKLMLEHEMSPTHGDVEAILRAQQLWDRTMAVSVLRALDADMTKAVLIVGRFHGDFARGTVAQLRTARPLLDILYISILSEDVRVLQDEDRDRADLIVYTGGVSTAREPIDPIDDLPEEEAETER